MKKHWNETRFHFHFLLYDYCSRKCVFQFSQCEIIEERGNPTRFISTYTLVYSIVAVIITPKIITFLTHIVAFRLLIFEKPLKIKKKPKIHTNVSNDNTAGACFVPRCDSHDGGFFFSVFIFYYNDNKTSNRKTTRTEIDKIRLNLFSYTFLFFFIFLYAAIGRYWRKRMKSTPRVMRGKKNPISIIFLSPTKRPVYLSDFVIRKRIDRILLHIRLCMHSVPYTVAMLCSATAIVNLVLIAWK